MPHEHQVQTLKVHVWVSWEPYQENEQSINKYIKALGTTIVKYLNGKEKKEKKKKEAEV